MHKLPSLTPQEVIKILEKKGFILERTKESHQIFRHPETRNMVVIPYHKKDLPRGTFLEILKQAGISKEEIEKMV